MEVAHHHLRVHQDISTEDQSRNHSVDEFDSLAAWEERSHESENDQHPKSAEEVWLPCGEVVLGLAGEQAEEDEDASRDDQCLQHDAGFVEARDHTDAVGLKCREACEE